MILWIAIVIIIIFLCAAVVSTKAVFKNKKDNTADEVYRENCHYRNQYREEVEETENVNLSAQEEIAEELLAAQEINGDKDSESEL